MSGPNGFKIADAFSRVAVQGHTEAVRDLKKVETQAVKLGSTLDRLDGRKVTITAGLKVNKPTEAQFATQTRGFNVVTGVKFGDLTTAKTALGKRAGFKVTSGLVFGDLDPAKAALKIKKGFFVTSGVRWGDLKPAKTALKAKKGFEVSAGINFKDLVEARKKAAALNGFKVKAALDFKDLSEARKKLKALPPFSVPIRLDLSLKQSKYFKRLIGAEAWRLLWGGIPKVPVDLIPRITEFRKLLREIKPPFKVKVDVYGNFTPLRAQLKAFEGGLKVNLDIDRFGLSRALRGIGRSITGTLRLSAIAAGFTAITTAAGAAASAIASVGAAIVALIGVAGVIPGLLGGIAAVAGTLFVGLQGVTEAITTGTEATGAAPSASGTSAAAARATAAKNLKAATTAQTAAEVAQRKATDAVAAAYVTATNRIKGYKLALEGASVAVGDAVVAEHQAEDDLRRVLENDQSSPLEKEAARQAVKDRKYDVKVAKDDQEKLQKTVDESAAKGVEGSDEVVAAKAKEAAAIAAVGKAEDRVAKARAATSEKVSAAAAKAAAATSKLSKNGQDFVSTILGLLKSKEFLGFKNTIQDALLDGLGGAVKDAAKILLPVLTTGMKPIATALNLIGKDFLGVLTSPDGTAAIANILDKTAAALELARPGIKAIGEVILALTSASADFLPQLATSFSSLAKDFSEFIHGATTTTLDEARAGKKSPFAQFVQGGLTALVELGHAAISVGKIIGGFLSAQGKDGATVLGTFANVLAHIADVINSPEVQRGLGDFLDAMSLAFKGIFEGLGPNFGTLLGTLAKVFASLATAAAPILNEVLKTLADVLTQIGPDLSVGLSALVEIFGQFVVSALPALVPLVQALATAFLIIAKSGVAKVLGEGIVQLVTTLAPILPQLATTIVALIPSLVTLVNQLASGFVPVLISLLQFIADHPDMAIQLAIGITSIVFALTTLIPLVVSILGAEGLGGLAVLLGVTTPELILFGAAIVAITTAVILLWPTIKPIFNAIGGAIGDLAYWIETKILAPIGRFIERFIFEGIPSLGTAIGNGLYAVDQFFKRTSKRFAEFFTVDIPNAFSGVGGLIGDLYNAGVDMISGLASGIIDSIPGLSSVLDKVSGLVPGFLGGGGGKKDSTSYVPPTKKPGSGVPSTAPSGGDFSGSAAGAGAGWAGPASTTAGSTSSTTVTQDNRIVIPVTVHVDSIKDKPRAQAAGKTLGAASAAEIRRRNLNHPGVR